MSNFRTGCICIVGRPNVGKSTLLNCLLEQKISIVSRKPQTTRYNLLGIKTTSDSQLIFIDTPGIQNKTEPVLNRYMNKVAINALDNVDIVLFVVEALKWNGLDDNVVSVLKKTKAKVFLIVNKIDKFSKKKLILPFIRKINDKLTFSEIIPISAKQGEAIKECEKIIYNNIPEGRPLYAEDCLTDKNERFFAAEFLREKLMSRLGEEIPYKLTVTIDSFREMGNGYHIHACIWVEKEGQKAIVIGKQGRILKIVGQETRKELEVFFAKKVNLKTWVKVKKKWTNSLQALKQLGYL